MATIRKTGWEHDGAGFTVRWASERGWGGPEIYVEDVIEDETGAHRPDLISAAEKDWALMNGLNDELIEAEDAAREDAEERRVDAYLDERRGL